MYKTALLEFFLGIPTCENNSYNQQLRARHLWNVMAMVQGPSGIVAHCQDVTVPSTTARQWTHYIHSIVVECSSRIGIGIEGADAFSHVMLSGTRYSSNSRFPHLWTGWASETTARFDWQSWSFPNVQPWVWSGPVIVWLLCTEREASAVQLPCLHTGSVVTIICKWWSDDEMPLSPCKSWA